MRRRPDCQLATGWSISAGVNFCKGSGTAAAGAVAAAVAPAERAKATPALARVDYPSARLANVKDLEVDEPIEMTYPDTDSPGRADQARHGPPRRRRSRRGHRRLLDALPAQGLSAHLQRRRQIAELPRPLSRFDCERGGMQICGHATQNLPQFALRVDDNGDIFAEGIDELIYGRLSNVLAEGDDHGIQARNRPPADHPGGRQGAQRHLPLLHRRLRLQGLHVARQQAGRHGARSEQVRHRPHAAATARDRRLVRPGDVQHRQAERRDVHIVIKPDKTCVVNSGLGSIRGARMAETSYCQALSTQLQRLTDPMVWRYGQMQPTSWEDALDLVAEVTCAVIDDQGEDGVIVSAFDHGGAGGGYENTWGTGKLYFGA